MAAITHPKSLKRPFSSSTNAATVSSPSAATMAMQLLEASFDVNLTFRLLGSVPACKAHHQWPPQSPRIRGAQWAHSFW